MKEPPLPGTPLVAKEFAAAADHVMSIPTIVTSSVVCTLVVLCHICNMSSSSIADNQVCIFI